MLNNILEKARNLQVKKHTDPEFSTWKNQVQRNLSNIYGENSNEYKQFMDIRYDFYGYRDPFTDSEQENLNFFNIAFENAKRLLASFIEDLNILTTEEENNLNTRMDIAPKSSNIISKKKYQIFISSTYTDLIDERQAAVEAVLKAGHIPAGMELFRAGREQMETIKQWIDESDIYLLLLGKRYGSIDSSSRKSYTELEYRYALEERKMPGFAIILKDCMVKEKVNQGLKKENVYEIENIDLFNEFEKYVKTKIVGFVASIDGIKYEISENIKQFEGSSNLIGWVRSNAIQVNQLKNVKSEENTLKYIISSLNDYTIKILKDAVSQGNGTILVSEDDMEFSIQTDSHSYCVNIDDGNSIATHMEVIYQLENNGLIVAKSNKQGCKIFQVTALGYEVGKSLKSKDRHEK
jgi:hypothetical protein